MKFKHLLLLPVVFVLGACSTTYTPETDQSSNYDFASVETFHVIGDDHLKNPMVSDINRVRIDDAVITAFKEQGKELDDTQSADVLISYFIVTKDKVKVNSTYSSGYGYYNRGYAGVNHVSTRNYVEGTLVIDIIDNESQKTVWRSTLTKSLKDYDSVSEREQAINNAVKSMMNTFPSQQVPQEKKA
jgi:hypothetical protein